MSSGSSCCPISEIWTALKPGTNDFPIRKADNVFQSIDKNNSVSDIHLTVLLGHHLVSEIIRT